MFLHAKLRNRTYQGLDRQGQGQGLTSLLIAGKAEEKKLLPSNGLNAVPVLV